MAAPIGRLMRNFKQVNPSHKRRCWISISSLSRQSASGTVSLEDELKLDYLDGRDKGLLSYILIFASEKFRQNLTLKIWFLPYLT